jgi:hypothetical protein
MVAMAAPAVTPTGTITIPEATQVAIQVLKTTHHLIPTGMKTLGELEVEV